ncbi:MAG TPA: DUF5667 domain-containing protein [Actinomycetota bacterium]|nr:DUF5667 domain-containing protein [Actinomycetota bacterium]
MSNNRFDEEAFARMLEGAQVPHDIKADRMKSLVAAIERARPASTLDPAFASALRDKLTADIAVVAEAEKAARVSWRTRAAIWMQAKNDSWRRSLRVVAATGMAALMLGGTSAAFASAHDALPGQWNYGLKRFTESAQLSVTRGPLARGNAKLDAARTRLDEIRSLAAAGNDEASLYVATFGDMDHATIEASELLVEASRLGAGLVPLETLASFTAAQRSRLEAVLIDVPPGARPAARDSLATLVLLGDRIGDIIEGCPCPGNPLEIAPAGSTSGLPCSCAAPAGHPAGVQDREPRAGEEPSPTPTGTGSPAPQPSSPGTDLVPGTDADDPVNDVVDAVNDILDGLGLPGGTPSVVPLPTPTVGL